MSENATDTFDEKQLQGGAMEFARRIWLAGLGAFAKAEGEGSKIFELLVKEGEAVEARNREAAEGRVEEMKDRVEEMRGKASDTWDRFEQVFQDRVARALNSLGIPTNDDIQNLSRRVEELNESVKKLTQASESQD